MQEKRRKDQNEADRSRHAEVEKRLRNATEERKDRLQKLKKINENPN